MSRSLIIILLVIVSCSTDSKTKENNRVDLKNKCNDLIDTLFYGMEPYPIDSSEISIVDIRKCFTRIKNDTLYVEIGLRKIPDSITYNNPNISKGYSEFGLEVSYRHRKDTNISNLVFSLHYDNFEKKEGAIKGTFNDFLNDCESSIYLENNSTPPYDYNNTTKTYPIDNKSISVYAIDNYIVFGVPRDKICAFIGEYIKSEFNVKISYNNAKQPSKNNFLTNDLVSDTLLRHVYLWNSSRRTE